MHNCDDQSYLHMQVINLAGIASMNFINLTSEYHKILSIIQIMSMKFALYKYQGSGQLRATVYSSATCQSSGNHRNRDNTCVSDKIVMLRLQSWNSLKEFNIR